MKGRQGMDRRVRGSYGLWGSLGGLESGECHAPV